MLETLLSTNEDLVPLILRITLAVVIFPHGAQKLFGWFGGYGFKGTFGYLTQQAGLPTIIATLVILGESLGSIAVLLGILTRFSAISIGIIMVGAALIHKSNGFFINWHGAQKGEGFEFHLLAIGIALALGVTGGGLFSLDQFILTLF
ncbi:DoxX family protein [Leptospira inadai serovar Lyme str. 10]|uniref:DoxX family protein n=2 Tax=Leptospira inadai serovar Lyme TaxID=293084 RepID=V6HIK6_9LEPT|nr:DoxX family protein [Leptospira inadai]EQA36530.1 DoxX family protein [Leptospira inadai serovar Lyme str. 10]PNV75540.1 DoxX family protein [Leptospira inadai serovar Lyme]